MSFVREVFKVLYSPFKAFKEIVRKPDIKGPLLVLVLVLIVTVISLQINASKVFLEFGTPDEDQWTESKSFWTSNGALTNDTDRIAGNYSIKSFVSSNTLIRMKKTNIGQFNCSGDTNYKALSFRIKWTHQNDTFPTNATLRIFSDNKSHYFERVIKNLINSSGRWTNVTVNVGSENNSWYQVGSPNWENVTELEFRLDWLPSDAADLTMTIDDLYFGKFVSFLNTEFYSQWVILSLIGPGSALTDFLVGWATYVVFLWLVFKIFHIETGPLGTLFTVTGYTFVVRIIFLLVNALLINALPPINFPLKAWSPVEGEEQIASESIENLYGTYWYPTLTYQLSYFLPFVFHAWIIVLCAIAIRFLRELTWGKAVIISGVAYIMALFFRPFIPI